MSKADNSIDEEAYSAIRSIELQEIMGQIPHWIIRYGILVLLCTTTIFVVISFFIYLPVKVETSVTFLTAPESVNVLAPSDGYIDHLYFRDGQMVKAGSLLAAFNSEQHTGTDIRAEFDGHIYLLAHSDKPSSLRRGTPLFLIVPQNQLIYAAMSLPPSFTKKLKASDHVELDMDDGSGSHLCLHAVIRNELPRNYSASAKEFTLNFEPASRAVMNNKLYDINRTLPANLEAVSLRENLFKRIFKL